MPRDKKGPAHGGTSRQDIQGHFLHLSVPGPVLKPTTTAHNAAYEEIVGKREAEL